MISLSITKQVNHGLSLTLHQPEVSYQLPTGTSLLTFALPALTTNSLGLYDTGLPQIVGRQLIPSTGRYYLAIQLTGRFLGAMIGNLRFGLNLSRGLADAFLQTLPYQLVGQEGEDILFQVVVSLIMTLNQGDLLWLTASVSDATVRLDSESRFSLNLV